MFQPAGAGALVSAAAPSSVPRCATIAIAATAASERDGSEHGEALSESWRHGDECG